MTNRVERLRIALEVRRLLARSRRPRDVTDRLTALRRHALERSRFYGRHHRGLEHAPLHELPPLTKDHLLGAFDEVVTDPRIRLVDVEAHLARARPGTPLATGHRVGVSSGSSGRPGVLVFDRHEWSALIANAAQARAVARRGRGDPSSTVRRRVRSAKVGSPLGWHLSAQVGATLADPRQPTLRLPASTPLDDLVARLDDWKPDVLNAYASVLGLLTEEQRAGRLAIGPEEVYSGAEPLTADVRRRVDEAWGVEVFDQYVTSEAGFIAAECSAHDGMHVMDDHVVVEVVDTTGAPVPDGRYGDRALLTVLSSRTVPLVRYEVDDRVRLRTEPCPCGHPAPLLDIEGRARDILWFQDSGGQVPVHPVLFSQVMDTVRIGGWQVHRDAGGIRVSVARPAAEVDVDHLSARLRRSLATVLDDPPPVTVTLVESISRGAGGKATLVVDHLATAP